MLFTAVDRECRHLSLTDDEHYYYVILTPREPFERLSGIKHSLSSYRTECQIHVRRRFVLRSGDHHRFLLALLLQLLFH